MLKPKHYLPRIADGQISEMMKIYGAICVEGPKWCGKTWASMSHAKSGVFIADPEQNFMNKKMADPEMKGRLHGGSGRII